MIVYRLSRGKYRNDLSGRGAELAGGRWNSKGIALLYTSESIALCTVEIAVHMPLGLVPTDYYLISLQFPDDVPVKEVPETQLPAGWKAFPHANQTQEIGDAFVLASESLVLKVPSATVQGAYNYLFNPRHQDFSRLAVSNTVPFEFDKRLFVKE